MNILGFCKLRDRHGGAAPYWDPARRAAATGASPVAGATHGRGRGRQGERRPVGAATHEDRSLILVTSGSKLQLVSLHGSNRGPVSFLVLSFSEAIRYYCSDLLRT